MSDDGSRSRIASKFVRHAGDGSTFSVADAFGCAAAGVGHAFATQRNFKIHAVFAALAVVLGFALGISQAGWLAIVLCIVAVFSLEMLNTAVESIVDLVSPEWNSLAKVAKDCAAGSVFVAAIGSLVVAAIVFVPPVVALVAASAGA